MALTLITALCSSASAGEVVVIVSAKSDPLILAKNQIADIFLGKTNQFPGGRRAVPIDQAEGVLARDEFYAKFANKSGPQIKAYWSKMIFTGRGLPPKEAPSGAEVKKLVAADIQSIGYIDQSLVDETVRVLAAQ